MTAAVLLNRPPKTGGCPLRWCMKASDCGHDDPNDGHLHYGRPSSVETYAGDDLTVAPFQFNNSDETTGPRVEVGADDSGEHRFPLTPEQAFEFVAAVRDVLSVRLVHDLTLKGEGDRTATVHAGKRVVHHGRYDYWLVKLSFFDPNDGDQPVVVEVERADAAAFARYVEAAAAEVTR